MSATPSTSVGPLRKLENRYREGLLRRLAARIHKRDARAFFPTDMFPWIPALEARTPEIKAELMALIDSGAYLPGFHEVSSAQRDISKGEAWKTFVLHVYGHRIAENCAKCPRTAALLADIPGMTTAMFSVFHPGAEVPTHTGPYNGYLRYHLGLLVPDAPDACGITVKGETRQWTEGGSLLFDDTWPHSAWNRAASMRIVLFLDVLRPLPFPLNLQNRLAHFLIGRSDRVREARANLRGGFAD